MNTEHYDVLIIGGGPGGISAASKVALQGKRAVIINDGPLIEEALKRFVKVDKSQIPRCFNEKTSVE